jgi:hypothetical protein
LFIFISNFGNVCLVKIFSRGLHIHVLDDLISDLQLIPKQLLPNVTAHQTIHFGLCTALISRAISTDVELQVYSATSHCPYKYISQIIFFKFFNVHSSLRHAYNAVLHLKMSIINN